MKPYVSNVRWSQALQMAPEKINTNTLTLAIQVDHMCHAGVLEYH